MRRTAAALGILLCGAALGAAGSAHARPPTGGATTAALAALARAAAADSRTSSPDAVQRRYDTARWIEEGLAAVRPTRACRGLYRALVAAARGSVLAAEGVDRHSELIRLRGERRVSAGLAAARRARESCRGGIRAVSRHATGKRQSLLEPLAGEAFFGRVRVVVPAGTRRLELRIRGRLALRLDDPPAGAHSLALPTGTRAGRGTFELTLRGPRYTVRERVSAWLLPAAARGSVSRERADRRLEGRLAAIASGFAGYAGIYVHDMTTGRTAGWNAAASFPAASTVKLGVLAAAAERFGPRTTGSPYFRDMQALAAWSSNLAANRLLRAVGAGDEGRGRTVVEAILHRLGAAHSTYPGPYRIGSSRFPPVPPPLTSTRTTSAADLGHILAIVQATAAGSRRAGTSSGLSAHEARLAIALLLGSEPSGDNVGLFRPWLPAEMPVAQKHGWISSTRHSTAIIYGRHGPVVVVLLTYRNGLSLHAARELGRQVVRAALS